MIGLLIGGGIGWYLSTTAMRERVKSWDANPSASSSSVYRVARWVTYAPAEQVAAWYDARASEQNTRVALIAYWALLLGNVAVVTHLFRLRSDQSTLDQLWH